MASNKRLPFSSSGVAFMAGGCAVALHREIVAADEEPDGISAELGAFLHLYGQCAACGAPVARELSACVCGKYQGETLVLVARFSIEHFYSKYQAILNREKNRSKAIYRKQCIEENGGAYTKQDIAKLFEIQRGLCYYCGSGLGDSLTAAVYDVDHYRSIYQGGRNDIYNLVLACPKCNRTKNHADGDWFSRKIMRQRTPEAAEALRKIRKDLKAYLKARGAQSSNS